MGYQFFPSLVTIVLLDLLHISIAWKITILALIITDIKTYPLVWHVSLSLSNVQLCSYGSSTSKDPVTQRTAIRPTLASG